MSDDDDFGFDDDEPEPQTSQDHAAARLAKKVEKLEKQLEAKYQEGFEAAKKEIETAASVTTWATKVGNEKLGGVFLATKPGEVTEEGFLSFAADLGFKAPEEDEGGSPAPSGDTGGTPAAPQVDNFHRTGGAVSPSNRQYSRDEWLTLVGTDPVAADAALKAGKVDLSGVTAGLGPDK